MNFKQLLQLIVEESREKGDSFRTTGEAKSADKRQGSSGDEKAKDAARKRDARAREIPRDKKSKPELVKEVLLVRTKSGKIQLIFKDSFNKQQHEDLTRGEQITLEDAKKAAADPKFEQTRASKLLLGDTKSKGGSAEKKQKKEETKSSKDSSSKKPEGKKESKGDSEEEKPRRLSKQEMFNAMGQMSAEQLAGLDPEMRDDYFKKLRNPPSNQDFDNYTFEGISAKFGISPISSLPFNQQVLNAILFLSKLKVGAGEQEMQTFATLNPGSTDFTKRAYLQASKILSQVGDECLNNLLSAAEGNDKQAYTEGSVDMKCGDYKFKIEAGGEFTVSTDKLNQSNKLFKGLLSTALNTAFANPELLKQDPGVKKMLGVIDQKSAKVSKVLISAESLPIILQNEKYVKELQKTPVILGDGTDAGMVLDKEGNLNPAASLENYTTEIQKSSKQLFKKDTDTGKSPLGNSIANTILRSYLRGDGLKKPEAQPNHLVTANGIFALSDQYIGEISNNAVLNVKPSTNPIDSQNVSNYKSKSIADLKKWRALIEEKKVEKEKAPSLKQMMIQTNTINPMDVVSQYMQANMDFEFNASLIPGFKPDDINSIEYNYVRIGKKVIKIPVVRADRLSNQLMGETYIFLNNLLVESLSNNFVLSSLVKVNLLTNQEASLIENQNVLTENKNENILKSLLSGMVFRASEHPFKISLIEQIISEEAKRDYKMEYRNYHGKPKQKKERAARTRARELMKKKGRAKVGDGKDIDHKKPIRSGGSNGINNLRARSKSSNRSDNGHHKGEKQNHNWK
jgi:hypothetical protein